MQQLGQTIKEHHPLPGDLPESSAIKPKPGIAVFRVGREDRYVAVAEVVQYQSMVLAVQSKAAGTVGAGHEENRPGWVKPGGVDLFDHIPGGNYAGKTFFSGGELLAEVQSEFVRFIENLRRQAEALKSRPQHVGVVAHVGNVDGPFERLEIIAPDAEAADRHTEFVKAKGINKRLTPRYQAGVSGVFVKLKLKVGFAGHPLVEKVGNEGIGTASKRSDIHRK
jgi:hypothetical protein